MLSVAAGLFVRSFLRVLATDPGFRVQHVVNTMTTLPTGRYSNGQMVKAFYVQAVEAAQQIPGVALAGASTDRPLDIHERRACTPDQSARPGPSRSRLVAATWTVGQYFEALGIPLKRGRFFTDADGRSRQPVVIISETLARDVWGDADPVGRQIKWGIEVSRAPWMTVVGVVGDIKQGPLDAETLPLVYEPIAQEVTDDMPGVILPFYSEVSLVTRTTGGIEPTMSALRASLRADPALRQRRSTARRHRERFRETAALQHERHLHSPSWRSAWQRWGSTACSRTWFSNKRARLVFDSRWAPLPGMCCGWSSDVRW
jgi:hypothetical protein